MKRAATKRAVQIDRVALVRAYANIADDLPHAGLSDAEVATVKADVTRYLKLREIIRQASGETIDLKAYEADMRHLIDTYIQAEAPRIISDFGEIGLLDLIVKTGIADAVAACRLASKATMMRWPKLSPTMSAARSSRST